MILKCLSAPWHSWELLQCSTHCTIFSCFQGDVLCDIDNCINPWFTQSAGKETAPFPTVGFLIARWSVIYRHLHWSPLCAGRKTSGPRMVFVAQNDSWALWCSCLSLLCFRNVCTVRRLKGRLGDILSFLCHRLRAWAWPPLVPRCSWLKTQLCSRVQFSLDKEPGLGVHSLCLRNLSGQRSFSPWTFSLCSSECNWHCWGGIISSKTFETLHFKYILHSWPAVSELNGVGKEKQTAS